MHYYKKNIGDYAKKCGRLTMLQHGSYTLLMDACYDREEFPTLEQAIDWTWASTKEEREAVEFILQRFFTLEDGVYVQKRIQEEIEDYKEKSKTNSRIAQERETKRKANSTNRVQRVDEPQENSNEAPPNQEPLTINHKFNTNVLNEARNCPHDQIIDIYHETLPMCPKVKTWTPARATQLRARWNEEKKRQNLEWWKAFFEYIAKCDFLVGRTDKPFFVDLEWIAKSKNFTKIREGKYQNRESS